MKPAPKEATGSVRIRNMIQVRIRDVAFRMVMVRAKGREVRWGTLSDATAHSMNSAVPESGNPFRLDHQRGKTFS